jgi:hypothetical protein
MSTQLQLRGGTTPENLVFTGAQREVTIDTDKNSLVVHDGVTAGGFPVATEGQVVDGTDFYSEDIPGGSTVNQYILVPNPTTNVPNAYYPGSTFSFVTSNTNTGPSSANFQGLGVKNIKIAGGSDPAPGDITGRVSLIFDSVNDWFELQLKPSQSEPQIRKINASVSGNALTITLDPCIIDFRAPSLGSGAISRRNIVSPLSIVVPAGATIGTVSAALGKIAVVAIDNGASVELAVINGSGFLQLDESTLISTTAITSGASSASIFYSSTARAGVPYRVVGLIESTQAAAGTWVASPSKIQGQGGQQVIGISRSGSATAQATTSGTSIDFTSIPSVINKISVVFSAVSTTGTSRILVQVGSGSVDATGYVSTGNNADNSIGVISSSAGFIINYNAAALSLSAILTIIRVSGNTWACSHSGSLGTTLSVFGGGTKTLGGALDRVRLTTVNGTDTFDAGAVNIYYEV